MTSFARTESLLYPGNKTSGPPSGVISQYSPPHLLFQCCLLQLAGLLASTPDPPPQQQVIIHTCHVIRHTPTISVEDGTLTTSMHKCKNTIKLKVQSPSVNNNLPLLNLGEQMVSMQKIISSWIGAKRLTPVMIQSKQPTLIYNWKCVR